MCFLEIEIPSSMYYKYDKGSRMRSTLEDFSTYKNEFNNMFLIMIGMIILVLMVPLMIGKSILQYWEIFKQEILLN